MRRKISISDHHFHQPVIRDKTPAEIRHIRSLDHKTGSFIKTDRIHILLVRIQRDLLKAVSSSKILDERHKGRGLNPWVFPGGDLRRPSKDHLKEPKKAWKKIIDNAGILNLRIHDLRRTVGSYMAMEGINTPLIQKALGHRSLAAASIYQRVNNDPVKRGMDQAISTMQKFAAESSVVELRKSKEA